MKRDVVVVALILTVLFLLGLGAATFAGVVGLNGVGAGLEGEQQAVAQTQALQQLLNELQDAETGQRGFLLTHKLEYLQPYNEASLLVAGTLDDLEREGVAQQTVAQLREISRKKLDELARTIELEQSGRHEEALRVVKSDEGKRYMDELRLVTANVERQTSQSQRFRAGITRKSLRSARVQLIAGASLIGVLMMLLTGGALVYGFQMRRQVERRTRELKHANENLEAFTGALAHDFKQPLRAMQGLSTALLADGGDEAERKEYAAELQGSARRLATLTEDLLKFSRMTKAQVRLERVAVADAVRGVEAQFSEAQWRRVRVVVAGESVMADRSVFSQALQNLIGNAMKFSDEGEPVEVTAEKRGEVTRVSVTDRGRGIEFDKLEEIFRPFVRLQREEEGTGLGLSLARAAVERMGGSVGVSSVPRVGSVFWVELPSGVS